MKDWTTAKKRINAASYSTNWQLPTSFWNALPSGTNYISARVYDGDGNKTEQAPLFYVKKDLLPLAQSSWNPAKNAVIATTSPAITFTLDETGDCKWSLTDQAYGAMASECSGDGTANQTCVASGLSCGGVPASLVAVYHYTEGSGYAKISPNSGASIEPWKAYWIDVGQSCALTLTK